MLDGQQLHCSPLAPGWCMMRKDYYGMLDTSYGQRLLIGVMMW